MLSLEGYRILDFGTAWAGPMSTQLLADMGAEVIKVETQGRLDGLRMGRPIVGDDIAGGDEGKWPNLQPAFHALNRNKMSITVDIKKEEGLSLIRDLVKISDVVSDNFSPGVMARAGLDYDSLIKIKPDIITISLSGVGQYGPLKDATLYANTIMALSGLSSLLGYPGEPPLGMSAVAYGDANASIHAAFVILAALVHRKMTGEGQQIDLAETQMGSSLLGEALMDYQMNGRVARPQGNRHPYMSPHNNYPCAGEDKWVSIAVKTNEEWRSLCQAMGNPAWSSEERFGNRRPKDAAEISKIDGIVDEVRAFAANAASSSRISRPASRRGTSSPSASTLSFSRATTSRKASSSPKARSTHTKSSTSAARRSCRSTS